MDFRHATTIITLSLMNVFLPNKPASMRPLIHCYNYTEQPVTIALGHPYLQSVIINSPLSCILHAIYTHLVQLLIQIIITSCSDNIYYSGHSCQEYNYISSCKFHHNCRLILSSVYQQLITLLLTFYSCMREEECSGQEEIKSEAI